MKNKNNITASSSSTSASKVGRVGYEFKSRFKIVGLPLLHISFAFKTNGAPIPAIGLISIGQFGAGIINISQFGIGILSLSQFTISVFAAAQVALAYSCISQVGLYINQGCGQVVTSILDILSNF
ncbi:MAG: zinc ribbon domain-containing protein [Marinilabiliales bacterium]|nr:MAG: zinc ribbon domain-containing protein [Marinilabiliales bacterium]